MESMHNRFNLPFTFDRVVRMCLGFVAMILLFLLLNRLSGVLLPFIVAWLLAYLMYPLMKFFQYKCRVKNRPLSILLTLVSVLLVVMALLALILPPVIAELARTGDLIGAYISQMKDSTMLPEQIKQTVVAWVGRVDVDTLMAIGGGSMNEIVSAVVPKVMSFISGSFDFFVSMFMFFIVFMYLVFILLDYEKIGVEFKQLLPGKYRGVFEMILKDLEDGMNQYFRGQFLIASIVGVLIAAGLYIVGLPLGILMGLTMGVLTLIPYMKLIMLPVLGFFAFVGAQDSGVPFWAMALETFAVIGVVQVFEDMFLIPKIMGKKMGLNPAVILLSLSIWGSLLGVAGMIIALPVTTILISYYKRYVLAPINEKNERQELESGDEQQ
ncbi:MAG: AI-2E family transporter [Paludibacteraceae bacterium]|nr:AI-2E family transporter [Paludibacteraceae bacterium]